MSRESLLARTMVELADSLADDFDVSAVLELLVDRCVDVLDVGAAVVVLLSPNGDLGVVAASSEAARRIGLGELEVHDGPCIDCLGATQPIVNIDLSLTGGRWPRFVADAGANGFRSVHAVPMRRRGTVIGALGLLQAEPGSLRPVDAAAAQALADVATVAVLQHRATLEAQTLIEQLNGALRSRVLIEQAKGIIAERDALDMEQAFSALRHYARSRHLRLADLCREVVQGRVTTLDEPTT